MCMDGCSRAPLEYAPGSTAVTIERTVVMLQIWWYCWKRDVVETPGELVSTAERV